MVKSGSYHSQRLSFKSLLVFWLDRLWTFLFKWSKHNYSKWLLLILNHSTIINAKGRSSMSECISSMFRHYKNFLLLVFTQHLHCTLDKKHFSFVNSVLTVLTVWCLLTPGVHWASFSAPCLLPPTSLLSLSATTTASTSPCTIATVPTGTIGRATEAGKLWGPELGSKPYRLKE